MDPAAGLDKQMLWTAAQAAVWLNDKFFAVGRWDGTLAIVEAAPLRVVGAAVCPAQQGIEMVAALEQYVLSSNGTAGLVVWGSNGGEWNQLRAECTAEYDSAWGVANCATVAIGNGWLVVGHAKGWLSFWSWNAAARKLEPMRQACCIASPHPVNPYGLVNVRGIAPLRGTHVACGSEDGNVTIIEIISGTVKLQQLYSPEAKFGINGLSVCSDVLLVTNCVAAAGDPNLWVYRITEESDHWGLTKTHCRYLAVSPGTADAVYSFSVATEAEGMTFVCSTKDGGVWWGNITQEANLDVKGNLEADKGVAPALCYHRNRQLGMASFNLYCAKLP